MNKEDIIMNAVFFGVLTLSILLSIHMINNDIEIDTTPLYWPETFPLILNLTGKIVMNGMKCGIIN